VLYCSRCRNSYTGDGKEVMYVSILLDFLISVMASVVGYYVSKWLDGGDSDN